MIEARIHHRTYRQYRTITREQAFAAGFDGKWLNVANDPGQSARYDYAIARKLLTHYFQAIAIDFCRPEHNTNTSRYTPPPGYIVYVKSTSGIWGKAARTITE